MRAFRPPLTELDVRTAAVMRPGIIYPAATVRSLVNQMMPTGAELTEKGVVASLVRLTRHGVVERVEHGDACAWRLTTGRPEAVAA